MPWLIFFIGKLSLSVFLRKKRYVKVQEANFFFQVRYFIYKSRCSPKQYLTFLLLYSHHQLIYLISQSLISTIFRKKTYIKLQKANFFFQARCFVCKGYCFIRRQFTIPPPYSHPKTIMNTSGVLNQRYQNFIGTTKANNRVYRTIMPYISKVGQSITSHNTNLISQ